MSERRLNVPNAIAGGRLLLSPGLVLLALAGRSTWFLGLFVFLEATDWLDGKLAVTLDQRTTFGSRVDTVADMVMYGALLVGLVLLEGDRFLGEWPWMVPGLVGYLVSWVASLVKFGTLPSYHALTAKATWLLALVAVVALLVWGEAWPLRVAAVMVAVANVEAILLTLKLDRPRSDVPSIFAVSSGEE